MWQYVAAGTIFLCCLIDGQCRGPSMNGRDHVAEQLTSLLKKVFFIGIRNPSINGKYHLLGRLIHTWQGGIGVGHKFGLTFKVKEEIRLKKQKRVKTSINPG